jgi:alpha-beta hydrolase superfamily lysophospholipase
MESAVRTERWHGVRHMVLLRLVFAVAALLVLSAVPSAAAGRAVTFTAPDGVPLSGMLYEATDRPAPAVVLVHMLGRSKDEWASLAERLQQAGVTALAIDLRGHGQSGGNGSELPLMVGDVHAAVSWLATRPGVRIVGLAGASLGANLAAIAASDAAAVRAVALLSPSLDYRGIRLDAAVLRKLSDRAMWFAASAHDPYALRTVRELTSEQPGIEQRVSNARAHGTRLLVDDPELARALVDWLKARLIF